jgi:hypothetical protein
MSSLVDHADSLRDLPQLIDITINTLYNTLSPDDSEDVIDDLRHIRRVCQQVFECIPPSYRPLPDDETALSDEEEGQSVDILTSGLGGVHNTADPEPVFDPDEEEEAYEDHAVDRLASRLDGVHIAPKPYVLDARIIKFDDLCRGDFAENMGGSLKVDNTLQLSKLKLKRMEYITKLKKYNKSLKDTQRDVDSPERGEMMKCEFCEKSYKHDKPKAGVSNLMAHVREKHLYAFITPVECFCKKVKVWDKDKRSFTTVGGSERTKYDTYKQLYDHCRSSAVHNFTKFPHLWIEKGDDIALKPSSPKVKQFKGDIHLRGLDS